MKRIVLALVGLTIAAAAEARGPRGLHDELDRLSRAGRFSGAVVVRDAKGIVFARGYGFADPFTRRTFLPSTAADSASLAKPVTAAAILSLARDGKLDLDAPVQRYLPDFPYATATVRQLLSHSAGLPGEASFDSVTGRTNEAFLAEMRDRRLALLFEPGTGFDYCNFCYTTLALLIERVTGAPYLGVVWSRAKLPRTVTIRPRRLADWFGRAIGYRRTPKGMIERADSYETELFYGSGNLSVSALQLAQWGSEWWKPGLAPIRAIATEPAVIAGAQSGLSWGSWYCDRERRRCHYLGHHEGFHHMLYWDADRRISVAMVSNNSLGAALQQPLQRALVAFAERRPAAGRREFARPVPEQAAAPGRYDFAQTGTVTVTKSGGAMTVERHGIRYPAYPIGPTIRYVPGLDIYIGGGANGSLHWLGLYEQYTLFASDR